MSNYNIPPLLQQWIDKLCDRNTPQHIKENYAMMLDNVREACEKEVARYRNNKFLMPERKSKR